MSLTNLRKTTPLTTITPGEVFILHLRGKVSDTTHQWCGVVLAVDAVAFRIDAAWSMFGFERCREDGEHAIPWRHIDSVEIVAVAAEPSTEAA